MKILALKLPEAVYEMLSRVAQATRVLPEDIATDILVDAILSENQKTPKQEPGMPDAGVSPKQPTTTSQREYPLGVDSWHSERTTETAVVTHFSVLNAFSDRDRETVSRTQQFVDAAQQYDGVTASKNDQGIAFDPNFVFIERVYTEDVGFVASFYGKPDDFQPYGIQMEPGRSQSYSRFKVKSREDLILAIKALHISANWKDLTRKF